MKPALVTGACGFSGGHMVKLLVDEGVPVRATDLARAAEDPKVQFVQRNLGIDFKKMGVEFVPSDLADKETLKPALKGVGTVYHTASLYDYSAPMAALEKVNLFGTTNLCEAMVEEGIDRLVHWSTAGVYGHPNPPRSFLNPFRPTYELLDFFLGRPFNKGRPYVRPPGHPTNQPFTEEGSTPLNTTGDQPRGTFLVNDYSITKWKQEQIVQRFGKEKGLKWTVIRPAPLYGPGSDYGIGGIVIGLAEGMTNVVTLDLRNYMMANCHVRDIVRAAYFLGQREDTLGQDYNVSDPDVISQLDFIMDAALMVGRKIHLIPFIRMPWLLPIGIWLARLAVKNEQTKPNYRRVRMLEESSIRYLSSSYWISSGKLLSLGYKFEYPDFRLGLKDMIEWFIKVGWIQ